MCFTVVVSNKTDKKRIRRLYAKKKNVCIKKKLLINNIIKSVAFSARATINSKNLLFSAPNVGKFVLYTIITRR